MGLTDDDVAAPVTANTETPVRGVDLDGDGIDDVMIRNLDLTEQLMKAASDATDGDSEYRRVQLEKFRTTSSAPARDDTADVSPHKNRPDTDARNDAQAALEYRKRMLDEFRNRKACGTTAKSPMRSPRREKAPAEA